MRAPFPNSGLPGALALAALALTLHTAPAAEEPLLSGPPAGERPLPFTSTQVTGPQRGRQYCYV